MTGIYFATPLAWPWYALVGSLLTFAAGLAASYSTTLSGAPRPGADPPEPARSPGP
jgi:hypothetical protein